MFHLTILFYFIFYIYTEKKTKSWVGDSGPWQWLSDLTCAFARIALVIFAIGFKQVYITFAHELGGTNISLHEGASASLSDAGRGREEAVSAGSLPLASRRATILRLSSSLTPTASGQPHSQAIREHQASGNLLASLNIYSPIRYYNSFNGSRPVP